MKEKGLKGLDLFHSVGVEARGPFGLSAWLPFHVYENCGLTEIAERDIRVYARPFTEF